MSSSTTSNQPKPVDLSSEQAIWLDLRRKFVPSQESLSHAARQEAATLISAIVRDLDICEPYPVSSHRKLIGPFIVFGKRSLQFILRPIIKVGFARQLSLNESLLTIATSLSDLKVQLADLQKRLEVLEQSEKK